MNVLTKAQIEKNKENRLKSANIKNIIKRNVWGIEKELSSNSNYDFVEESMTYDDLAEESIKAAIKSISNLLTQAKSIDSLLSKISAEDIIRVCKEQRVDINLSKILGEKNVSDKFKWNIIYSMDKSINEK